MRWRSLVVLGLALGLQFWAQPARAWDEWPGEWSSGWPARDGGRVESPVSIQSAIFRLEVPFRTQKDGGRWQISNCGPATLGMVLDAYGVVGQTTDDLRFRAHTYQGTVGMRTGTGLQHLAHVAEDFGVSAIGLYNEAGEFNYWALDDLRGQLRLGHLVVPLVRLYLLPGYEGAGSRWGHYILLTGLTPDAFFYSDALQTDPSVGVSGFITASQLERAMQLSHIPGQAVAFEVQSASVPSVWTR